MIYSSTGSVVVVFVAVVVVIVIVLVVVDMIWLQGKVPVNEFGTVNLFKSWMLPPRTVYLPGMPFSHYLPVTRWNFQDMAWVGFGRIYIFR